MLPLLHVGSESLPDLAELMLNPKIRAPEPEVIEATKDDDLAAKLEALAKYDEDPAPDRVKKAPLSIKSPSDLQFHLFQSLFPVLSLFVTCPYQFQQIQHHSMSKFTSLWWVK